MVLRLPLPGSSDERSAFDLLQRSFVPMFTRLFADPSLPRTVVVVPSLTLAQDELAKIDGVIHYEERMLGLLLLLRMPGARVVYVSSLPIHPDIVSYHLDLMPDVADARSRLHMISLGDSSLRPLTEKMLDRPDVMTRVRTAVDDPGSAHVSCFVATAAELSLAVQLGLPIYAPDPSLWRFGTKSEARRLFRRAGIAVPDGFEDVWSANGIVEALETLRRRPAARAVVKLDDGFSGEGNAVIDLRGEEPILDLADRLEFESRSESWEAYRRKLARTGAVVEEWLEGEEVRSPSVQCRIDPTGRAAVISTHDQMLGGPHGQVFMGCRFPSDCAYRPGITRAALDIAKALAGEGVVGRFGVDFVVVRRGPVWDVYGLEINLRKGGTTLPFMMLDFLARGAYDAGGGEYHIPGGETRAYVASDNVVSDTYRGMAPADAVGAVQHLAFDRGRRSGVVLHLLGALPGHGKLGLTAIAADAEAAQDLFDRAVAALDAAAGVRGITAL